MTADTSKRPTRIAVVGAGHWGPHQIRNFEANPDSRLVAVCDASAERIRALSRSFPGVRMESSADLILDDPEIDAVVIATPTSTHHELAKRALLSDLASAPELFRVIVTSESRGAIPASIWNRSWVIFLEDLAP